MKNTFAVTMTLLLALTLGGSFLGYHKATHPAEAAEAKPAEAAAEATPGAAPETAAGTGAEAGTAAGAAATNTTAAPGDKNAGTTNNAGTSGVDNSNAAGATGNAPAETSAAAKATAPEGNADEGKAKFAVTCAGCHGADAHGGLGPNLTVAKDWTETEFHTALREGRTPEKTLSAVMPKFATTQVTDQDIANIHAFIKTLN